jgi:hypothetical protein
MTIKPTKGTTTPIKKPSGVWVAFESTEAGLRLVGVFDTLDIAETACAGCKNYQIANVKIGENYRNRVVNWRAALRASST